MNPSFERSKSQIPNFGNVPQTRPLVYFTPNVTLKDCEDFSFRVERILSAICSAGLIPYLFSSRYDKRSTANSDRRWGVAGQFRDAGP